MRRHGVDVLQPCQSFLGPVVVPPSAAIDFGLGDHTPHDGVILTWITCDLTLNDLVLFLDFPTEIPVIVSIRQDVIGKSNTPSRQDNRPFINVFLFARARWI